MSEGEVYTLDDVQELRVRAQAAPWMNAIRLLMRGFVHEYEQDKWRKPVYLTEASFAELQDTEHIASDYAEIRLSFEQAQALMDDLWACGLRPTEGKGSAGALAAMEDHLKDMQRIAFEVLEAVLKDG